MTQRTIYVLGYAPFVRILSDLEFNTRPEAAARAKEENTCGKYRGRGVKVYKLAEFSKGPG